MLVCDNICGLAHFRSGLYSCIKNYIVSVPIEQRVGIRYPQLHDMPTSLSYQVATSIINLSLSSKKIQQLTKTHASPHECLTSNDTVPYV
jgi:hypothetical protein